MPIGTVIAIKKAGKVVISMFYIMIALIGIGIALKMAARAGMGTLHRA